MENESKNEKKDTTKEKIILFVIGVLVGAAISTTAFFVYTQTLDTSSNANGNSMQMPGGMPPEMPSGDSSDGSQSGTPPEMPSGSSSNSSQNNTPPEKPSDNSSSSQNSNS